MVETAIVILNYNGEKLLERFLPSVVKYSEDAQIIVADNGSTDQSVSFVEKRFSQVKIIRLLENLGFAGGYNAALSKITAKHYILLNSDVEVVENWWQPLILFLKRKLEYAACQPKILNYPNKDSFDIAGASGGFIDSLGYPYCRGRIFSEIEQDNKQYNHPVDILWASGACLAIRSDVFHQVGGFDSDFFAHMEEIDLCWRIRTQGYKIKCLSSQHVYHVGGATLNSQNPFKVYLNFRNNMFMLIKNLPENQLLWKIPLRLFLDWIAAIKFLFDGNPKHAWKSLLGTHTALFQFKKMFKKRLETSILPKGKVIIFSFFIRKKRKFSDL